MEYEIIGACSRGWRETFAKYCSENLKGRDHLEGLSIDRRMLLKYVQYDGLDWIHLARIMDQWRALLNTTNMRGISWLPQWPPASQERLLHVVSSFVNSMSPRLFCHNSAALPYMLRYECSDICRAAALRIRTSINLHRTFISPVAARGARCECMRSSDVIYCLLLSS
jgi:hypothetical protein